MQIFSLFILDRRYSVATLQFVEASDVDRITELARRELFASPDHLAIEIHDEAGERCQSVQRAQG